MTEFDELKLLGCIQELLHDRGEECTADQVREFAKINAKRLGLSLCAALEAMEDDLLSRPPE